MLPNSKYLKHNPTDGRVILSGMCGRPAFVVGKAFFMLSVCEGFNYEISMISEYECIRCFISKNIVGVKGII